MVSHWSSALLDVSVFSSNAPGNVLMVDLQPSRFCSKILSQLDLEVKPSLFSIEISKVLCLACNFSSDF